MGLTATEEILPLKTTDSEFCRLSRVTKTVCDSTMLYDLATEN